MIDVGIIVLSHFTNPAKYHALDYLKKVLEREIRCVIPTSTFLGAYHVMTVYLKLSRVQVANSLSKTLGVSSEAFYENLRKEDVIGALSYSPAYSIESWDSVLLALAERLGTKTIISIDKKLKGKVEDFVIINPIPEDIMEKYHNFLKKKGK